MNHSDHVALLKPADLKQGGIYADFGAGSGAFTLALRQLTGPEAVIYAVDRDRTRLAELEEAHRARFHSDLNLIPLNEDFSRPMNLPPLDGIVMANSLHFFKDKEKILKHVRTFLKSNGSLLLVEYNTDRGNVWVPYPLTFESFQLLASKAGFSPPRLLKKVPSHFLREFYSAMTHKSGE